MQLIALFRLAFATAARLQSLNLAAYNNSPAHSTKGTQSGVLIAEYSPPIPCKHTVSGSISLPSRGSFRLSLTVLVHYRSLTSV